MQLPSMGCLSTFANGVVLILICVVLVAVIVALIVNEKSRSNSNVTTPVVPSASQPEPVEPKTPIVPEPINPVEDETTRLANEAAIIAAEKEVADVAALLEKERAVLAKTRQDGLGITAYVDARSRLKMYEKGRSLSEANAKEYAKAEADLKKAGNITEAQIQAHTKEMKRIQANIDALQERELAAMKTLKLRLEKSR